LTTVVSVLILLLVTHSTVSSSVMLEHVRLADH